MRNSEIETLKTWIEASDNIVFFGGAGVSTESGIPDFRSTDGLYRQEYKYPPETILSHTFFERDPEEFFRFYRAKLIPDKSVQPNAAHRRLAELEREGKLRAVITQNIDGLHQKAGSRNVLELHGSIWRNYCTKCGKSYSAEFIRDSGGVPHCACGGLIKPDVVLYEEGLDEKTIKGAVRAIAQVTQKRFGTVKVMFDATLVATALVLSLLFFGEIRGLGLGTIIAALAVGRFCNLFNAHFKPLDKIRALSR